VVNENDNINNRSRLFNNLKKERKKKGQHSQKYAPQIFTTLARVLKFVSVTQLLHEAV